MLRLLLTLPILLATCFKDEGLSGYADPGASYVLQEISGTPAPARATISFPARGQVAGDGPCNSYSAQLTVPLPWFALGPIAATKRACPNLVFETAYFTALGAMTLAEIAGPVLILSNDAGDEMVFQASD